VDVHEEAKRLRLVCYEDASSQGKCPSSVDVHEEAKRLRLHAVSRCLFVNRLHTIAEELRISGVRKSCKLLKISGIVTCVQVRISGVRKTGGDRCALNTSSWAKNIGGSGLLGLACHCPSKS